MWVMGGRGILNKNDVWYSTDGVTWTQAILSANWSARNSQASLVYDNKMWIMGGDDGAFQNDVWYSTDGITWTQATASAGWSKRRQHTALVYDNKMWVIGGWDGVRKNDIWYSTDGASWVQAQPAANWAPRLGHSSLNYDNKMWIMGGDVGGAGENDVWNSVGYDRLLEATITVCWQAKDGRIIGEDNGAGGGIALNGILDGTEDINGNSELDSPVKFRELITNKEKLRKTYLGGP
jgi:hypothetical protein